jgi:hypothetical protein
METTHPSFPTLSSLQTKNSRPKSAMSINACSQQLSEQSGFSGPPLYLQDLLYCWPSRQIGKLPEMAKRKIYKITTVARAKAACAKAKLTRSAKTKRILAVRCPTCGASPRKKCKLSSGQPRANPHRDRRSIAKD